MARDSYTWEEIVSQSQTWRATLDTFATQKAALESFLSQADFDQIVVVGCGSTHYLAQTAAATLSACTGIPSRAFPSSEVLLFPSLLPKGRTLLITVSRSGTTTETLWVSERFRKEKLGPVLAVTCYPESPLAQQADF